MQALAAVALAQAGDTASAEKLAAELDKDFPLDTLVQRYWLPIIRAAIALQQKDPNRAIELLEVASPIELAGATNISNPSLWPAYVRGEAYLMLHDGNRAAAEFQKFIDHRGIGAELTNWDAGPARPRARLLPAGRHDESPRRISGFPDRLERRRP